MNLIKNTKEQELLVVHFDNYFAGKLCDFITENINKFKKQNFDMWSFSFKTNNQGANLANGAVYIFSSSYLQNTSKKMPVTSRDSTR